MACPAPMFEKINTAVILPPIGILIMSPHVTQIRKARMCTNGQQRYTTWPDSEFQTDRIPVVAMLSRQPAGGLSGLVGTSDRLPGSLPRLHHVTLVLVLTWRSLAKLSGQCNGHRSLLQHRRTGRMPVKHYMGSN